MPEDKSRIVEEGNYHKFTKSKDQHKMRKMLLETGDREMVEVRLIVAERIGVHGLTVASRPLRPTAFGA